MPTDGPVYFGRVAAQRTRDAVIRVERGPYPGGPPPSKWPIIGGGSGVLYTEGIATNTITAFNGNTNTYGSGPVQAYQPVLNANTNTYQAVADSSIGAVTCYNFSINSNSIASGARVGMMQRNTANGSLIWELIWAC